ncbi:XAC2610-related protein [Bacteroides uniformis]|uniref:XAC2610-related protein n=1 Tax=Bacteroides TaxID=816 RepID=UPI0036F23422
MTLKDLNFDGQDDIAIPLGNYGNQRIQYEDGYLWDKTQKTYVPVKQLKEIANLRIDKEERCLFSFSRESAASYHYERYEYVDAELVKTAELIQTYRQAGGKLLFTEKHYQKGKGMRVVHSSVPIHEISHYWLKIVQK